MVVKGQGQYYVGAYFAGVELAIKASHLYGGFVSAVEKAVEVEHVVAAFVVMSGAFAIVAVIPNIFKVFQGLRLGIFDLFYKVAFKHLAETLSALFYLQGFIEQVAVARKNVDEVFEASYVVACAVDVDAAAFVGQASALAECSDDIL